MRELLFILALFLLVVWDISQNHRQVIGAVSALLGHGLRQLGLR